MQALGSLAERYADAILTVQGVFVGSWGDAYLPVSAPGSDLPAGADLAGGDAPCADTLGAKAGASAHAGGK